MDKQLCTLPDDARQVFSWQQFVDLCAGPCGDIDADQPLFAAYNPPDFRHLRDRFAYLAVTVQGGCAAFLLLGVRVVHFLSLLRLRFAVDVVKWIHRRFLILQLFDTSSLTQAYLGSNAHIYVLHAQIRAQICAHRTTAKEGMKSEYGTHFSRHAAEARFPRPTCSVMLRKPIHN